MIPTLGLDEKDEEEDEATDFCCKGGGCDDAGGVGAGAGAGEAVGG